MEENEEAACSGDKKKFVQGEYMYILSKVNRWPLSASSVAPFHSSTAPRRPRYAVWDWIGRKEKNRFLHGAQRYTGAPSNFQTNLNHPHTEFTRDLLQFQIATTPAMGITHKRTGTLQP